MPASATLRSAIAGIAILPLALLLAHPADAASSACNYFSPGYLGQPAAEYQANGYDDALSFARRTSVGASQLRYADTGNLCEASNCIGFSHIKCVCTGQ